MEKEIKIKVDLEENRKRMYNLVSKWMINEGYSIKDYDYEWFVDNVVNKGEDILAIDYWFSEDEYNSIISVCYTYRRDDNVMHMSKVELLRQKQNFKLPEFKKGE